VLHIAIGRHIDILKELIKASANVNIKDKANNCTPMFLAIHEGYIESAKELIRSKADLDILTDQHWSPLYLAVSKDYIDVVEELIKAKVDVNTKTSHRTPLHLASYKVKLR
jgi:ankyrin repeat protein